MTMHLPHCHKNIEFYEKFALGHTSDAIISPHAYFYIKKMPGKLKENL